MGDRRSRWIRQTCIPFALQMPRDVTLKITMEVSSVSSRVNIGGIDQPVSLEPRDPGKGRAFDFDAEVGFARPIIAAMAVMFGAIVDNGKASWRECCFQQYFHFNLCRTFFHDPLFPYGGFFAKENHGRRPFH